MIEGKRILGVVLARSGSKGFPGKNLALLQGRPLLAWPIAALANCPEIDRVILSTDSEELASAGRSAGAETPFLRPAELAADTASSIDAVCHALDWLEKSGDRYDLVVLLEPTSPLTTSDDVRRSLQCLIASTAESLVGIAPIEAGHPSFAVHYNSQSRMIMPAFTQSFADLPRRQDLQPVFHLDGSLYISTIKALRSHGSFCHASTLGWPMDRFKGLEVDDRRDLAIIAALKSLNDLSSDSSSVNIDESTLEKYIPGGGHTYSKGRDQFPANAPEVIVRGQGCTIWDGQGRKWLDYGMGLRSVILGHAYEPVLHAVQRELWNGSNFTRPSVVEGEVAEKMCAHLPGAEMIKFAKNGSDVTAAAIRLARAFTGRSQIAYCQDCPFYSFHDWFIGTTPCDSGVPKQTAALSKPFAYNNINSLETLLSQNGDIGAVILEPIGAEPPKDDFLNKVLEISHRYGALVIFDEMISGFRFHPQGAQGLYGVTGDLATWGKAVANGFSVSALTGRRDIMERGGLLHDHDRVFLLSATHGAETHSLRAAQTTVDEIIRNKVCDHIATMGRRLMTGFDTISRSHGIDTCVRIQGFDQGPVIVCRNPSGNVDLDLRTLLLQEFCRNGILIPYIAISWAHTAVDIDRTLEIYDHHVAPILAAAISSESVKQRLEGPTVKPVFRRRN